MTYSRYDFRRRLYSRHRDGSSFSDYHSIGVLASRAFNLASFGDAASAGVATLRFSFPTFFEMGS